MTGLKVSTFQERITDLVNSSGRTQTAIAAEFGVSKQTISAWITGQNSPRMPIVFALSYYFDVSFEWLMGFDVDKKPFKKVYSSEEENIIAAYRAADPAIQAAVLKLLDLPKNTTAQSAM